MKTRFKIFIISFSIAMFGLTTGGMAQPNPFENGNGSGTGGPPIGGGTAPIGSGITLILLMAAGYGIKRVFDARNKIEEPTLLDSEPKMQNLQPERNRVNSERSRNFLR